MSFRRRPDLGFSRGLGLSPVAARVRRCALRVPCSAIGSRAARRPPTDRSVARSVLHSRLLLRAPSLDRTVGVAPSVSRRRRRAVGVGVAPSASHHRPRPSSPPPLASVLVAASAPLPSSSSVPLSLSLLALASFASSSPPPPTSAASAAAWRAATAVSGTRESIAANVITPVVAAVRAVRYPGTVVVVVGAAVPCIARARAVVATASATRRGRLRARDAVSRLREARVLRGRVFFFAGAELVCARGPISTWGHSGPPRAGDSAGAAVAAGAMCACVRLAARGGLAAASRCARPPCGGRAIRDVIAQLRFSIFVVVKAQGGGGAL